MQVCMMTLDCLPCILYTFITRLQCKACFHAASPIVMQSWTQQADRMKLLWELLHNRLLSCLRDSSTHRLGWLWQVTTTFLKQACPLPFDEAQLWKGEGAQDLQAQLRSGFHDITRVMDCVGCEKCKLWGKLQLLGEHLLSRAIGSIISETF